MAVEISNLPLPPSLPGKPLVGNLFDFQADSERLIRSGYDKFGPIFSIQLGPQKVAVLLEAENQQFFFKRTDTVLRMDRAYQFLAAMFGKVFFTADPETYQRQKPLILPPFRGENMPNYLDIFQEEINIWFNTLDEEGSFDLISVFDQLAKYIAAHALMGKDFRQRISDEFFGLYRDLSNGLDMILPPNLPLPKFIRRDSAKKKMAQILSPIIVERRANPGEKKDFLQHFAEAKYKDGTPLDDSTIIGLINGLIFAGHETTAGQGSWALIELLRHPDYLSSVQNEIDQLFPTSELITKITQQNLNDLNHLDWAIKETERLHSSAGTPMRYNHEAYELGGYHIPQGWLTMVHTGVGHRLSKYFQEPEKYDPLRFAPDRAEDKQHPFVMFGFGGGVHKCLGMNFANNEMAVFITMLLHAYDLELMTSNPRLRPGAGVAKPEATFIHYKKKK